MKLYMHAGSLNHGCEAIVRSTAKLIDERIVLYSEHPKEDRLVHLDRVCTIERQGGKRSSTNPLFLISKIIEVILKNPCLKHRYVYNNVIKSVERGELFLSIGGDNYCYGANPYLIYINQKLTRCGARTGLWGCSIEPDVLKNTDIIDDMKRYSFISARESITYNALRDAGVEKVYLFPDPAFMLDFEECDISIYFAIENAVGINISPLVQKLDKSGNMVMNNYIELINFIMNDTDMGVILIPHVCKPGNDDRKPMKILFEKFKSTNRIQMINEEGDLNCRKLKYVISRCRFLVTARTHASIAAYSTCIPTLVLGYSVKAKGIAKDIFDDIENYVVDLKEFQSIDDLKKKFYWIIEHEYEIKKKLTDVMPAYIDRAYEARKLLV